MLNKKSFIKIIILTIAVVPSRGTGTTALKINFEDLPSLVKEKNKSVQGATFSVQSGEARTGYLLRSYLPTLGVSVGGESFKSGEFGDTRQQPFGGIETKINLFKGGRDSLEGSVREKQLNASQQEQQKIYFEELTKARGIYWNLVFQKETQNIFKEALDLNEKNKGASEKRIQAGLATLTDRIEFEINKIQLEQDLRQAELMSSNFQRELNAVLGLSPETNLETIDAAPHQHDEGLLALKADLINSHREILQLKANQEAFEFQKKQFYRWWTPSIDGYAGYFLYTQREREAATRNARYETVGGIKVTLDIFDGFQSKAEGAAAGLQAMAFESLSLQRQKELEARFEAMKSELKVIHELVHIGEKNLKLGKLYFDRTLGEYKRGVKNSPDVLSATQKYIEYKKRYSELRKNYHLARADILAMVGR